MYILIYLCIVTMVAFAGFILSLNDGEESVVIPSAILTVAGIIAIVFQIQNL